MLTYTTAFKLKATNMRSGQGVKLTVLLSLACYRAASEDWDHRHYEKVTFWLQQCINLLERTGRFPGKCVQLEKTFNFLLPYTILDLVSCNFTNQLKRKNNFILIKSLLFQTQRFQEIDIPVFTENANQAFFVQIFRYFTLQEQLDLFQSWEKYQSPSGFSLSTYTQLASGFAQKKPDLIFSSLLRFYTLADSRKKSTIAYFQLLLGDVNQAETFFLQERNAVNTISNPTQFNQWGNTLEILCSSTSDWLINEVLKGYRDLNINGSLQEWFNSKRVLFDIEKLEYKRTHFYKIVFNGTSSTIVSKHLEKVKEIQEHPKLFNEHAQLISNSIPTSLETRARQGYVYSKAVSIKTKDRLLNFLNRSFTSCILTILAQNCKRLVYYSAGLTTVSLFLAASKSVKHESTVYDSIANTHISLKQLKKNISSIKIRNNPNEQAKNRVATKVVILPVSHLRVSCFELKNLINSWLYNKSRTLNNQNSIEELNNLADKNLTKSVEQERLKYIVHGYHDNIKARVITLAILSKDLKGLEAEALIEYRDQQSNENNQAIKDINERVFTVIYTLRYETGLWRLHNYINLSFM
ncbi:MAG TPA: IMS domain-containing protein [Prochlorococcaceae cyanobacterium AMR_MDS_5431]|nr:IMS domain-containing protein [Prochlorococcaceae cyanobacterium AMR_MDS_5431]